MALYRGLLMQVVNEDLAGHVVDFEGNTIVIETLDGFKLSFN